MPSFAIDFAIVPQAEKICMKPLTSFASNIHDLEVGCCLYNLWLQRNFAAAQEKIAHSHKGMGQSARKVTPFSRPGGRRVDLDGTIESGSSNPVNHQLECNHNG